MRPTPPWNLDERSADEPASNGAYDPAGSGIGVSLKGVWSGMIHDEPVRSQGLRAGQESPSRFCARERERKWTHAGA